MKKALVILLSILTMASIGGIARSAYPVSYTPQWTNISTMVSSLVFSGTNGVAAGSVDAKSGASKVEGTLTVYKRSGNNWIYVDSDTDSTTTESYVILSVDFDGISGVEYKSVFEVAVTRNGIEETEIKYNYKTCP